MKTTLYLLLALILLSSCVTQSRKNRKCTKAMIRYETAAHKWGCPMVQDSTFVQSLEIIRDTTIYVPIPSQTVHDSIPVISTNGLMNTPVSLLETTYSRSKTWVENGTLKHTLDQRPSTIPVILPGVIHTSASNTVRTIKVPYYVDRPVTKPFSWWQRFFLWTGVIIWWAAICFIVFKLLKFKIV